MTKFRLSWWEEPSGHPGLPPSRDKTCVWIASEHPGKIINFATAQGWDEDRLVMFEVVHPNGSVELEILTTVAKFLAWDHDSEDFPPGEPGAAKPRSFTLDRLSFLSDLRRITDAAVENGVLTKDRARGLLLLAEANTDLMLTGY